MESTQKRDWLTREEATAFIGNNTSFYLEKWKLHSETTLKGWNWAAMFFSIEWMAYRKMYLEIVLFYVIIICTSCVTVFLIDINGELLGHGFRILIGAFGNALYRKKALRILEKIDAEDDSERLDVLARRGGVSPISVVVMILLEFVYGFLIFM